MYENVLKFKPPLAFIRKDADTLVSTVDRGLTEWATVRVCACWCVRMEWRGGIGVGMEADRQNESAIYARAHETDREGATRGQEGRRRLLHCGARGL